MALTYVGYAAANFAIKAMATSPIGWDVKTSSKFSVIQKADTKNKLVALTFDDGPDPRFTPKILDILKKNNIKATFFVVGKNVERYPSIVKRTVAEGSLIGNHSWDHPHLRRLSTPKIKLELDKTAKIIEKTTGSPPKYMRPPYGQLGERVYKAINSRNYKIVLWSDEFQEHLFPSAQLDSIYVSLNIEPGGIILGHDGRLNHIRCVKALPLVISKLKAKGYRFVTIDELYNKKNPPLIAKN